MSRKMLIDGEVEGAKQFDFDLFVIGGGSGGVRASRTSAGFGAKVCIELLSLLIDFLFVSSRAHGSFI